MLVLSRKAGQRIQIGSAIEVTVFSTRKGRVKLGFRAPPDVTIRRQEIEPPGPADAEPTATALEREHAGNEREQSR